MLSSLRAVRTLAVAAVVGTCPACGPSGPTLHPVRGKVTVDGKPAEGVAVVFQPAGGGPLRPSGVTTADGTFTLSTHAHGEGAPAGEYLVLFTWHPPGVTGYDTPPNKLPNRYGDPTTGAQKATVVAGPNDLPPFDLKAK